MERRLGHMLRPIPVVLSTLLFLSGCSKSLSRPQALSLFEKVPAFHWISQGALPDGALYHGSLQSITVDGIVQNESTAIAYFRMTYHLTAEAVQQLHAARVQAGIPAFGNNSVCTYDESQALARCLAGWGLTRYDDGWRFDDGTMNGGMRSPQT